jgi:hypothetical protein
LTWDRIDSSKSGSAEPLDPLGHPQQLDPSGVAAEHRRVERAPAQVVHGDRLAIVERSRRGVVGGGGLRLRHRRRACNARDLRHLLEQLAPERPPVRRVGQHEPVRLRPLRFGHAGEHVVQHGSEQGGDRVGDPSEHHRRGVTEAALDLPADAVGMAHRPAARDVTGDQRAVVAQVDQRRGDHRPVAERDHLDARVASDRGRDERGTEIHSDVVAHDASLREKS